MDINLIDNTSRRYCKYGIWLISALTFAVIIAISVNWLDISLVSALAVSALYSIIVNLAYGSLWKRIAKSAPGTMAKFYLAASALRLITAALVVIVFCVINRSDKELIRNFIFVFFAFYLVMLVFDSVFFARIEKNNNLKIEK